MIKDYVKLLRIQQWYKNIVVFLPLVFALSLTDLDLLIKTIIGFFMLCFVSSSNYVINDIIDRKKDLLHPEKKSRPIASGKINVAAGLLIAIIFLAISLVGSFFLSVNFMYAIIFLFLFTQLYSFKLKHEPFMDILAIAINFVVRAISGIFIINVELGHWIIIGTFFLALFLVTAKRRSESLFLKDIKSEHRKVLEVYNPEISNILLIISTTLLIVSYAFFISLSQYTRLFITFPIILYLIFRYLNFVQTNSIIARSPELLFKDKKTVLALMLYVIVTLLLLYVKW